MEAELWVGFRHFGTIYIRLITAFSFSTDCFSTEAIFFIYSPWNLSCSLLWQRTNLSLYILFLVLKKKDQIKAADVTRACFRPIWAHHRFISIDICVLHYASKFFICFIPYIIIGIGPKNPLSVGPLHVKTCYFITGQWVTVTFLPHWGMKRTHLPTCVCCTTRGR